MDKETEKVMVKILKGDENMTDREKEVADKEFARLHMQIEETDKFIEEMSKVVENEKK